ncbi:hypothetical protein MMC18_008003 [Xylographa bjoerkii]|nr:hypothetical protein [Xylographa bjoerkii]
MDALTATVRAKPPDAGRSGYEERMRSMTARGIVTPYTVDRTLYRALLMLGIEDRMEFGKRCERFEMGEGGVTAFFADGTSARGSLLVGAEGVRSAVRRQALPGHRHVDTGGRFVYGKTPLTGELKARFPAEAMKWMTLISDETPLTLFLEPVVFNSDAEKESGKRLVGVKNYVYWVLLSKTATFGMSDEKLLGLSSEEAARLTLSLTEHWSPAIRSMLELQDVSQTHALRIASVRPDIPAWEPSAYLTFLGDSIHAMSPTGGAGANTAFVDAANLVEMIAGEGVSADSIGRYEAKMREYAKVAVAGSYMGGRKMYGQTPFEESEEIDV